MKRRDRTGYPILLTPAQVARFDAIAKRIGASRHAVMIACAMIGADASDDAIIAALPARAWRAGGS